MEGKSGKKKGWVAKSKFHPGGEKGKLHRELGVPEGEKIPAHRLEQAAHSKNPEIRRDAIRAETMKKWHHGSHEGSHSSKKSDAKHHIIRKLYTHPGSKPNGR